LRDILLNEHFLFIFVNIIAMTDKERLRNWYRLTETKVTGILEWDLDQENKYYWDSQQNLLIDSHICAFDNGIALKLYFQNVILTSQLESILILRRYLLNYLR
jgi:hypothetical protein